ncbi:MAG TPA: Spy/CpxP family protein refolding chaperone [Caulobacteraceae bacterium]|nr:Spy/CpxP family protein refolding chaperone [Caulobacteraceae bacterium]
MNGSTDRAPTSRKPARRRWLLGAALAVAFVAGGVTAPVLMASAQEAGMHGMMGDHGGMHAMAMAHVNRMLDQVGASADQKARIASILHAGFQPMIGLHGRMGETHAALHAILSAPSIDRGALEQLRARDIAEIDQASRTMVQAFADAAEVLRPEQRARLASLIQAHHAHP